MDSDDLKEKYRLLPLWGRLLGAAVIGLLPAAYVYFDEGETLETELSTAEGSLEAAKAKFEKARQQKADVPKLEEQKAFTEEQLVKAKQKLPDSYRIEDVLQKAATIAKEVGVKFVSFKPLQEKIGGGTYRYWELPIQTEIEGKFAQVAAFLDRVVHLEMSVFVRNIDISLLVPAKDEKADDTRTAYQKAREARSSVRTKSTFDMLIYRSLTDAEAAPPVQPAQPGAGGAAPEGVVPQPGAAPAGESASQVPPLPGEA